MTEPKKKTASSAVKRPASRPTVPKIRTHSTPKSKVAAAAKPVQPASPRPAPKQAVSSKPAHVAGGSDTRHKKRGGGGRSGGGNRSQGGGGGQSRGRKRPSGSSMKNISKNWRKAPMISDAAGSHVNHAPRGKNANKVRIAVMGGAEEVGRNMTMIEYGNDIILIDMGLQFPEEEMPGVDYVIPDVSYLKGKEKNIRGVVITHAHYDHIGAIPHLMGQLHNPPIFSARLTLGIIAKRQDDFPLSPKLDLREVDIDGKLKLGDFVVEFVRINHSVPDSLAIVVHTPEGTIIHTGDFKIDLTPIGDQVTDFAKLTRLGNEGVLAMLADSTNASKPGQQMSETYIGQTIEGIIGKAEGRVIVGTFASNLNRVQQLLWTAEAMGRFVVLEGYSMRTNVEIATQLGYLEVDSKTIISPQEATRLPGHKLMLVGTGAQGEERASLMRMATGEHRFFNIEEGDTVIFSSSVIPGNERTVQSLKDLLIKQKANVIHYQMMDVHAGGHAQQEDLKLMARLINPKYYVPIEGNLHLLYDNAQTIKSIGWPDEHVFIPSNGQIMEFAAGEGKLTSEMIPSDYVFVDGLGVGDVSEVVLRDRVALAEDGMVVVIVTLDGKTHSLVGEPDIISRGFIYMKGNKQIVEAAREKVKEIIKPHTADQKPDAVYIKNKIRDEMGEFFFQQIERRPMILPVVVEV